MQSHYLNLPPTETADHLQMNSSMSPQEQNCFDASASAGTSRFQWLLFLYIISNTGTYVAMYFSSTQLLVCSTKAFCNNWPNEQWHENWLTTCWYYAGPRGCGHPIEHRAWRLNQEGNTYIPRHLVKFIPVGRERRDLWINVRNTTWLISQTMSWPFLVCWRYFCWW